MYQSADSPRKAGASSSPWWHKNKRITAVVFACVCFSAKAFAEIVPGTTVDVEPPPGFVSADRFPGFIKEATGAYIMITEIPGSYDEATAGFSDGKRMQAQGMRILKRESVMVDGRNAMLMHVEQSAFGRLFKKWVLAVDRSGATTLIVAAYPIAAVGEEEQSLKKTLLAITLGEPTDPIDALSFTVRPEAPFEVANVIGQNLFLTPSGEFPITDEAVPFVLIGLSTSARALISNERRFAEQRVLQIATVRNVAIQKNTPLQIGHLAGYRTLAEGSGKDRATPLTIYQVILFDSAGYCLIQGVTPSEASGTYLPVFERIAESFALKDRQDKISDTDAR